MNVILDIVTNHLGQSSITTSIERAARRERPRRGQDPKSPVVHVNEYDPDFNARGVQAQSSLGESGRRRSSSSTTPRRTTCPLPEVFQQPEAYNARGAPSFQ